MEPDQSIEFARDLIYRGADHLAVQKFLLDRKLSVDDIRRTMMILESDFVKYQLAEQERSKVLNQLFVGLFILVIGLGVSLYGSIGGHFRSKVFYGLTLFGLWWSWKNWLLYRQPVEHFIPREMAQRRRRFRKRF